MERKRLTLGEWIPTVSVGYENPVHLQQLLDVFEAIARGESVRVLLHAPPRHAKTDTLMHGVVWLLKEHLPKLKAGYYTYSDQLSTEKSRAARNIAITSGMKLDKDAESDWSTVGGGGLFASGVGGTATGKGFNLLILDDLFKSRVESESALIRERRFEFFQSVAQTRLEPNASVIVCGTRWHPDDVQGRLAKQGWKYICLPALDEDDKPLWPGRWTQAQLIALRNTLGSYNWISLYQGTPRPKGGKVFGDATAYQQIPSQGLRYSIGIDLAYSEKTHSDYSVAVVLAYDGHISYVVNVIRMQTKAPVFKTELRKLCYRYRTARVLFKAAGTEKGTVDFFRLPDVSPNANEKSLPGINVEFESAREDKFQRAQPVAAAWNAGRVQVPEFAPWLNDLLGEIADFTGVEDANDDQVDGLATAWDLLSTPMPGFQKTAGTPETRRRM